jgi:hypothetical protein
MVAPALSTKQMSVVAKKHQGPAVPNKAASMMAVPPTVASPPNRTDAHHVIDDPPSRHIISVDTFNFANSECEL